MACAALVVLCVASGLARINAERAHPLSILGWQGPVVGVGRSRIAEALSSGQPAAAERAAGTVIAARPMDQTAIAAFGMAALAQGNEALAARAFRVSGRLGWRDPTTNTYWADRALAGGDPKVAAERTDALLRLGRTDDVTTTRLLRTLERSTYGRGELAARLALSPDWARSYVQAVGTLDATGAGQRIAVVLAAHDMGLRLYSDDVAGAANALLDRGRTDLALELWQGVHGPGAMTRAGLWQADFAGFRPRDYSGPFGWSFPSAPESDVRVEQRGAPGGRTLHVTSNSSVAEPIASQWVLRAPGRHQLTWRANNGHGGAARSIAVQVACRDGRPLHVRSVARSGTLASVVFSVPAACPAQRITLIRDPMIAAEPEAFVHGVRIDR